LLENAINQGDKIAICGDYDADGMTSTALLMRSLSTLGANVNYAIPSRMKEGYGINTRIVEEFHQEDVKIILTVDNGISAYQPIARAKELGLIVSRISQSFVRIIYIRNYCRFSPFSWS